MNETGAQVLYVVVVCGLAAALGAAVWLQW